MYYEGLGRRKRSVARVRLHAGGTGQFLVNGKPYQDFFGRENDWMNVTAPMRVTGTDGQFDVTVVVNGGGITGQSEAVRMGMSRALIKINEDFRQGLRKAGFLTRDSREKERKKPGLKRARKATQYTKR